MNSSGSPIWQTAPTQLRLSAGEVHLWRAELSGLAEQLGESLSPAEWIRAGRYHFERDRERFIAARGLVRTILGRYLGVEPRDLRFSFGEHGKPALDGICNTLRFNLSHSDNLLLLAVSHAREVGVDVEFMRADVPFATLADRYFEPEAAWQLRLIPPDERALHFYEIWTSTEARLKADGRGLSGGTRIVEPDRWSLLKLRPADGYAAALAVEGGDFQLNCWSWPK